MWRTLLLAAVILSLSTVTFADDARDAKKSSDGVAQEKSPVEKLKENPDDVAALRAFMNEGMTAVGQSMRNSDSQGALKKLGELEATAAAWQPKNPAAKTQLNNLKMTISGYRQRIEVQDISLAEIEKKVAANPDDLTALGQLSLKVQMLVLADRRNNPDEAEKVVEAFKAALEKVAQTAKRAETKARLDTYRNTLANIEKSLADGQKLTKMIGQDAAPLKIETWVNGAPLTDADLKGKVVFLDFWAVWCGPCIATFPHLKEWNEKYADKGLVMVGLTRYYNYKWNEETNKAARVDAAKDGKVSPAEEQAMLVKFAESYGLKHRFGIQADSSLSEYYGVTGIPHVVVIDQQGKIRLMKVGSGEDNAKAIGELLDKLLGSSTTGGQ